MGYASPWEKKLAISIVAIALPIALAAKRAVDSVVVAILLGSVLKP
jgi:hypothetical protein